MKRRLAFIAALLIVAMALAGCGKKDDYKAVSGLDKKTDAVIRIGIPFETNKALNTVANEFMKKYPNVSVQLQYIENYNDTSVDLIKDGALDIIMRRDMKYEDYAVKDDETGESVPTGDNTDDYFYDFLTDTEIDFSNTTSDLTDNYRHSMTLEDGSERTYQYCYPLGGEMRALFVNTTFLDSLGLSVPKNYTEFVDCCQKIKEAGYVPIQGHISTLPLSLGVAQAANNVVHNPEALEKMRNAEPGVSSEFADVMEKIYNLAVNRYCDYKLIEGTGAFMDTSELGQARSFLGISYNQDTFEDILPENNSGYVAFYPYLSSTDTLISSLIEDKNLDTKYTVICPPLNDEGTNSPAYITPYYGLCLNKNSKDLIWAREFVNFIFRDKTIHQFADEASIIPNAGDALKYVADKFGLNPETDITLCGQIYFSTAYNGYNPIANSLVVAAKCNATKYMVELKYDANGEIEYQTDEDGREFLYMGNGETPVYKEYIGEEDPAYPGFAVCTLQYYMDNMETEFAKYRVE